jgi:DNA-binding NarL/FixJ family response regulator
VVDDHPTVLWGICKLIEGEHPRLELAGAASTPEEALQIAARERPHVVLLDLDLGGVPGWISSPGYARKPAPEC